MPIHDQGYRHFTGARAAHGRVWWVIARTGLRALLRRRALLGLLLFAWLPFVVRAVQLYAASNLPQTEFLAPDTRLFREFLAGQEVFAFFLTVYAGAGLIANDLRANALQIYLSRPLTVFEYLLGKGTVLVTLLLLVTWLPAVLLLTLQVLFSGSVSFLVSHARVLPAITVVSLIQVLVLATLMLAVSSLSTSSRMVGALYAGVLFFSRALGGILQGVSHAPALAGVAVLVDLSQVADAVFALAPRYAVPLWVAGGALVSVVVASLWVLTRRVRGVEVVA